MNFGFERNGAENGSTKKLRSEKEEERCKAFALWIVCFGWVGFYDVIFCCGGSGFGLLFFIRFETLLQSLWVPHSIDQWLRIYCNMFQYFSDLKCFASSTNGVAITFCARFENSLFIDSFRIRFAANKYDSFIASKWSGLIKITNEVFHFGMCWNKCEYQFVNDFDSGLSRALQRNSMPLARVREQFKSLWKMWCVKGINLDCGSYLRFS